MSVDSEQLVLALHLEDVVEASAERERLVFACQGNEFSWHAEAARQATGRDDIEVIDYSDFGSLITACIDWHPGLGVMAINNAAGTVDRAARQLVGRRSAANPDVAARIDLEIGLSFIGSEKQTLKELNRRGVTCYLQDQAQFQIDEFKKHNLPWLHYERRAESTHAVQEALAMNSPDHIAVGPTYSAKRMGGFILGPEQVNPPGSITSFYILQRDPHQAVVLPDPEKTSKVTVLALNYPDRPGEFEKCLDAIEKVSARPVRFIPYRTGHPTKHDPKIRKNGGVLEIEHGPHDPEVRKLCAKINHIAGHDNVYGPFDAKYLGNYPWFPQEVIDLGALLEEQEQRV